MPVETPAGTRPAPHVIFLHIPKTAGMSLNGLFVRNYRGQRQYNAEIKDTSAVEWQGCLARLRNLPPADLEQCAVIKGHLLYGLHEVIPGPCTYVTYLRDPVKRILSHYKMIRRFDRFPADHRLDPSRTDWNLGAYPDFLRTLDNYQTRLISGQDFEIPFGACGEEQLALAKRNLDRHFAFVGLTERFDLSLLLMGRALGWKQRFYVPDNLAPRHEAATDPAVADALRRLNRHDAELYRYASDRLDHLVAEQGWNLRIKLGLYRAGNRLHQGLHKWRHKVKQKLGLERRPAMGSK